MSAPIQNHNLTGSLAQFGRHAVVFWTLLAVVNTIGAASFKTTLDREHAQVGETITLTLSFEGGQPSKLPQIPQIPNVQLSEGGNSRNVSIVNGQVTTTLNWTVGVTPLQPGDYTIPALQAVVDGQALTSQPLKFKADQQGATGGSQSLAFMRITLPKTEAYVGEPLTVEIMICLQNGVANAENILQYFEHLSSSPLKAEGFSVLRSVSTGRRRAQSGQLQYDCTGITTSIIPVRPGMLSIEANPVELVLQIPSGQRRRDSFFDPFNMFRPMEQRKLVLTAEPGAMRILPLPSQNVPPGFNGAVGNYALKVTAAPTNVAVGDPITLKIELSGRGSLDALGLPAFDWPSFKFYPPTAKVDLTDQLGIQGTKTFEQVVVPQSPDIQQIPSLSLAYFDPDQKAYRTVTHAPISVIVRPSTYRGPDLPRQNEGDEGQAPGRDIVYIKQHPGTLARVGQPLPLHSSFWLFSAAPVAAWLATLLWRRRVELLANNPRMRRRQQVAAAVREGLADLQTRAARNEPEAFFATLFRLLQEQLGERLDLPAASITEGVVDEQLKPKNAPPELIEKTQELFQLCNLARYAPVRGSQELAALVPKVRATLSVLKGLNLKP